MHDRLPEKDDEIRTFLGEEQAALWLGESLILALIEANLLNTELSSKRSIIVIAAKKNAKADPGCDPDVARAAVTHWRRSAPASPPRKPWSLQPARNAVGEPARSPRPRTISGSPAAPSQ
jgi:hypothetical protein